MGVLVLLQTGVAAAQEGLDLAWEWAPGASAYTTGPGGEIAFAIYLRTAGEDYAYDFPVLDGIDTCWWHVDEYTCKTTLPYAFDPNAVYYLVAVAYLADDPMQRSLVSNEIVHGNGSAGGPFQASPAAGGGGGGCFLQTVSRAGHFFGPTHSPKSTAVRCSLPDYR